MIHIYPRVPQVLEEMSSTDQRCRLGGCAVYRRSMAVGSGKGYPPHFPQEQFRDNKRVSARLLQRLLIKTGLVKQKLVT